MEHPKDVGDRTTLAVMLALREAGYAISVPFGENTRYDLIVDDGMRLKRVQCKTGRLREGAVLFNTASFYAHLPSPRELRRTYQGQIEYFGVHCRETGGVYTNPDRRCDLYEGSASARYAEPESPAQTNQARQRLPDRNRRAAAR